MLSAALLVALSLSATPDEKPKLVVLDLVPAGGVEASVAAAMTEALTAEVAARGFFSVLSSADFRTLLGRERQRQLLGCGEESTSCMTELAGALGAPFVMSGTLARLGDVWQLTLQTLDTTKSQPVSRSVRLGKDLRELQATLPWASAKATATPLPPPPSRVLPVTLLAVGGVAALGAGVLALDAFSRDQLLTAELQGGGDRPGRLKTLAEYEADRAFIGTERTVALVAATGGAALVATGVFLFLRSAPVPPKLALVPGARGVALVGVW